MFGRPWTVWCWDGSLPFFMTNTLVVIDPGDGNPDACQDDSQGCDNHPQPPILKVMLVLPYLPYHDDVDDHIQPMLTESMGKKEKN